MTSVISWAISRRQVGLSQFSDASLLARSIFSRSCLRSSPVRRKESIIVELTMVHSLSEPHESFDLVAGVVHTRNDKPSIGECCGLLVVADRVGGCRTNRFQIIPSGHCRRRG